VFLWHTSRDVSPATWHDTVLPAGQRPRVFVVGPANLIRSSRVKATTWQRSSDNLLLCTFHVTPTLLIKWHSSDTGSHRVVYHCHRPNTCLLKHAICGPTWVGKHFFSGYIRFKNEMQQLRCLCLRSKFE